MTPQREEYLYTQYVLSLINDGDWYRKVQRYLDNAQVGHFIDATCHAMGDIRRSIEDKRLSDHDRAYIYMACWSYYGYTVESLIEDCRHNDLRSAMLDLQLKKAQPTPIEPEVPMNQTNNSVAFETKHYVYGMDVANMTSGQMIEAIKKLEAEIADLKGVKAKSEHIKKRVTELEGMLVKVVEVLDGK